MEVLLAVVPIAVAGGAVVVSVEIVGEAVIAGADATTGGRDPDVVRVVAHAASVVTRMRVRSVIMVSVEPRPPWCWAIETRQTILRVNTVSTSTSAPSDEREVVAAGDQA